MSRSTFFRLVKLVHLPALLMLVGVGAPIDARVEADNGIVRVKSAVPMAEAITRIKADIAAKGIKFFSEIDQSKLAADAGIKLRPSTLLVFGNPPLGTQFITSNPNAGLDWPVRLLLTQDDNGDVWAVWTDFDWIARRHNITDRSAQFKMATSVVDSITSTIEYGAGLAAFTSRGSSRAARVTHDDRTIRRGHHRRRQCRHRRHRTGAARRTVGRDDRGARPRRHLSEPRLHAEEDPGRRGPCPARDRARRRPSNRGRQAQARLGRLIDREKDDDQGHPGNLARSMAHRKVEVIAGQRRLRRSQHGSASATACSRPGTS